MDNPDFIQINAGYGNPVVKINSDGKDVVIISDLHLSSGVQSSGNYDGTENFYADDSLARFLQFISDKQKDKKTILIINGDFIDFLRIRHYPVSNEEFITWQKVLDSIGINKTIEELKRSVSKKEVEYGLKTDDYKSVWKLHKCVYGHKILFSQLAFWLKDGNYLFITKGNHDLEWYWKAVRDYLTYILSQFASTSQSVEPVNQGIAFIDNALIIDGKIYVEHGHLYENMTEVKGNAVVGDGSQLNLPFGSFFNRYLINRLELSYPFLDNVRPSQKILPLLIRERFPLALKVLFHYIPFMLLIIPKKLYSQMLKYLLDIFIIIILPLLITVYAIYKNVHLPSGNSSFIGTQLINFLKNLAPLMLSYFFARIMAMARLSSPPTFVPFAKKIYKNDGSIQTVTFGHTHNPEQYTQEGNWYFNTGTWMPVYDLSMADVRLDKTYTYLHIKPGNGKGIESQLLLRWNDDALRPDTMILRDLK